MASTKDEFVKVRHAAIAIAQMLVYGRATLNVLVLLWSLSMVRPG